jgi:hypothetical protein
MYLRLAAITLLCAGLAPRAAAQDNTLLFENFEAGVPANWLIGAPWRLAQPGECGAVTHMLALNSGPPACNYVGVATQDSFVVLPEILTTTGGHPWQIAFDYILDVDATGDEVRLLVVNVAGQPILQTQSARMVNDGALHTVVMPFTPPGAPFATVVGLFLHADGVGDAGRGFAVDNVRVSNTLPGMIFCDGAAPASCPCGNGGGAFRGCGNSNGPGATLRGSGNPSVSADAFVLGVSDVPSGAPTLYFEGSAAVSASFGDGRLCAGGALVRLGMRVQPSNASAFPEPADPRISALSPVTAGTTRHYQAIYRDVAGPCGSGFNLSNGWRVTWGP